MSDMTAPPQRKTEEVPRDHWIRFLAEFTHTYRGAHARLKVLGGDVGYQVETEDRPFDGIAADIRGGESTVWITFGSTPANHLTRGVQRVKAIRSLSPTETAGPVLEMEAEDEIRTMLELSKSGEYALPRRFEARESR
jgi:hypothetical protein